MGILPPPMRNKLLNEKSKVVHLAVAPAPDFA
jgi:hypothetical protein